MSPRIDLTGQKFGRLSVLESAGTVAHGQNVRWLCLCDCGVRKTFSSKKLRTGHTTSCGCYRRENTSAMAKTHGASGTDYRTWTAEYRAWVSMKTRCNPKYTNRADYKDYAGRGISVCIRWIDSFENFLADVGLRPSLQHSLDRYPDNNGNYEPGNVRWASRHEQALNKRPRSKKSNETGAAA